MRHTCVYSLVHWRVSAAQQAESLTNCTVVSVCALLWLNPLPTTCTRPPHHALALVSSTPRTRLLLLGELSGAVSLVPQQL